MQFYSVDLAHLRPDPSNVRTIGDDDVADLVASMGSPMGQLTPIIVRPDTVPGDATPYYTVIAGARRVAAARQLGWSAINAVELVYDWPIVASAAENMVRKPMHPVDTWRAIKTLVDDGMTTAGAAQALGLEERYVRRLDMLGRVSPALIEQIAAERELPRKEYLATIAMAPHEVQDKALAGAQRRRSKTETVDWFTVAQACDRRRLPRGRAIFDLDANPQVGFEEDLFAEPGSEDQFTTTNVKEFLVAQTKALGERITASGGRMVGVGCDQWGTMVPPAGWVMLYDPVPKRWKKLDTRKIACAIITEGYDLGKIVERVMAPKPKRADAPGAPEGGDDDAPVERAARGPITKTVQAAIAAIKGEALREGVAAFVKHGPLDMLRLLLLTMAADNVRVTISAVKYGAHDIGFLMNGIMTPEGQPQLIGPDEVCAMAADVIAHCIAFDNPMTNFGTSGDVAEHIGTIVGAADFVPRMDTAEVLKGFSHDALIEIARAQGISEAGTAKQLRERMVDKMPDWHPVTFGAPVAPPAPPDDLNDDLDPPARQSDEMAEEDIL